MTSEATNTTKIETVQRGRRWSLTYKLLNDSGMQASSAAGLEAQTQAFVHILNRWDNNTRLQYLCYGMETQYTEADILSINLKVSSDDYRVRNIAYCCGQHGGYSVLLASFDSNVVHEVWEPDSRDGDYSDLARGLGFESFHLSLLQRLLTDDQSNMQGSFWDESRGLDPQPGDQGASNGRASCQKDTVSLCGQYSYKSLTSFG